MQGKIILCEYARAINNGTQFDALGAGVNRIEVPEFPAPLALSVLVETSFAPAEAGRDYPFEIKIIDPDGKAVGPSLAGSIRVNPTHRGATYAAFNIHFIMKNPVSLSYSLLVNGEEKDCVCLELKQGTQGSLPRALHIENKART